MPVLWIFKGEIVCKSCEIWVLLRIHEFDVREMRECGDVTEKLGNGGKEKKWENGLMAGRQETGLHS